jgi:cell division septal protein FtsQ
VQRRRIRRRRIVLVAVLAAVGAVVGAWFLLHTRMFSARVVKVDGSVHTPAAVVERAAGLTGHPALLSIDPGAAAAGVERLPWVGKAWINRDWPDGVTIVVEERVPVADVARPGGGWAELDAGGRVLADLPSPPAGLVQLVVPGMVPEPGRVLSPSNNEALVTASRLPPALAGQVSQIVTGPGQLDLKLTLPVTVTMGDNAQLRVKFEDVAAMLAAGVLHPGDVVDVSVPGSPVVSAG